MTFSDILAISPSSILSTRNCHPVDVFERKTNCRQVSCQLWQINQANECLQVKQSVHKKDVEYTKL